MARDGRGASGYSPYAEDCLGSVVEADRIFSRSQPWLEKSAVDVVRDVEGFVFGAKCESVGYSFLRILTFLVSLALCRRLRGLEQLCHLREHIRSLEECSGAAPGF